MYCLFCGSILPEESLFCLKCGKPTSKGNSESGESLHDAPTLASVSSPSDPYNPRPSTYYGSLPTEGSTLNPYAPLTPPPPPPPHHRRTSPGFRKSLFSGILVILLLSAGLGALLLLKQGAHSPSIPHPTRTTATSQSASRPTATPQSTVQSTTSATNTTFQSLPGMWTQCAVETATCQFSGTMTVAFGANGSFHYATESNGTACTDTVFGDPLNGAQKACYIEAVPSTANVWTRCADENATCSFLGTMTVAFGANGSYKYATESNGTACSNTVFGDPAYGTVKSCYLISPPTSATKWTACATENSSCSFTGKHEVAYGANGMYFYESFTNGTACSNTVFGDPASGAAKTCYYQ